MVFDGTPLHSQQTKAMIALDHDPLLTPTHLPGGGSRRMKLEDVQITQPTR